MNDYPARRPPGEASHETTDTVVVFVIPRQAVYMALVLVGLIFLSTAAALLVYRLLNVHPAADTSAQPDYPLPPPVTFIPPTQEQNTPTGRFEVSPDDDPALGPEDAPVVIIEFSDYQCFYCGLFARDTLHPLLNLYGDQIRFVYRDFVFYGPISLQAAIAAECAQEQGAFWLYHDRLFEQQANLSGKLFFALAEELDLDMQAFALCAGDPAVEDEVKADTAAGQALGVRGTPTFYVNGRVLIGAQSVSAFAAIIDEELALVEATPLQEMSNDR